ncbi:MAG: hypothetical protein KAW17_00180 [Candidatus Eisenbacteria sp.]|nr:hypothetical protein [Candidatus Eisenbacteria bacterium]
MKRTQKRGLPGHDTRRGGTAFLVVALVVLMWAAPDGALAAEPAAEPAAAPEAQPEVVPERADDGGRVFTDSWDTLCETGVGTPVSGGMLGSPLYLAGESGDPFSVLVLLDDVSLNHPQTGWMDWKSLSPGSVRPGWFSPGGWNSRFRDGSLDGSVALRGKRGRLDVPVSRIAFIQGPRGYRRNGAEFGRSVGGSWGAYLSIEQTEGTPTPSSIRHSIDQIGAALEGNLGGWYTRVTIRRHDAEREWSSVTVPPDGIHGSENMRETTVLAQGRGLGAERLGVSLWTRDLSSVEERLSGWDLARVGDRLSGGLVAGEWDVGKTHRVSLEAGVERRSCEWLGAPSRTEWEAGLWVGDEVACGGGTARLGLRAEYGGGWEARMGGGLGWSKRLGLGRFSSDVYRSFRAPGEHERRYSETPPATSARTGVRMEYTFGEPGRESGIRLFTWEEDNHPLWDVTALQGGVGGVRWRLAEARIRATGSLIWARWGVGERGRLWSSLRLRRVRDSGGEAVPLAPAAAVTLGGELRIPLPLRETSVVASCRGYGWTDTGLPEGGEQVAGMLLDAEVGFELDTFRVSGGIRNLFDTAVAESPFLLVRERWTGRMERFGTVPRNACQTKRETYFGISLVLYD